MLISPEEYLSLTDEIAFLGLKSKTYQAENNKLREQVIKQNETIKILTDKLKEESMKIQNQEQQLKKHISSNADNVTNHLTLAHQQQMRYLEDEILKLKNDGNLRRIRELEKKMAENRFINHEMVDFYQKINSLYMVLNKVKNSPSLPQLYKWVSIRKAEELTNAFATNHNLSGLQGGTQKTLNFGISKIMGYQRSFMHKKATTSNSDISVLGSNASKLMKKQTKENGTKKAKSNPQKNGEKNQNKKNKAAPVKNRKESQEVQILETESLTEEQNVENQAQAFMNNSESIVEGALEKQSTSREMQQILAQPAEPEPTLNEKAPTAMEQSMVNVMY